MSANSSDTKMLEKKYDVALATRNFEIELFWKRSIFFWGFIASAFIAYATIASQKQPLALLIACFGLVCSFAWTLVNRGSKRWQENWEMIVSEIENDVTGSLFTERRSKSDGNPWLKAREYSVSKITIALSDFTVFVWLILILYQFPGRFYQPVLIIGTILFIGAMLRWGRSSP